MRSLMVVAAVVLAALVGDLGCTSSAGKTGDIVADSRGQDGSLPDDGPADCCATTDSRRQGPEAGDGTPQADGDAGENGPQADSDAGSQCDGILQIDFPCAKEIECISPTGYMKWKTMTCDDLGYHKCCDGATCEHDGGGTCPPGQLCKPSGNYDGNDECVPLEGGDCGSVAGVKCAEGQFCELPEGICGPTDSLGVCKDMKEPSECPDFDICPWECGCNGVTFCSACERVAAGVHKAHDGECAKSECGVCVPDCTGKMCGNDGCGGKCGECPPNENCFAGSCSSGPDIPDCEGKQCGSDGLGGLCGTCSDKWSCSPEGLCMPDDGECGGLTKWDYECMGNVVVSCLNGKLVHEVCPEFGTCEENNETGASECVPPPCLPDCFGRECGKDGCGVSWSCGECGEGEICKSDQGICVPKTDVPYPGMCGPKDYRLCSGHTVVECKGGDLVTENCLASGRICSTTCGTVECVYPPSGAACGNLPSWGHCEGSFSFECVAGALVAVDCGTACKRVGLFDVGCNL